MPGIVVRERLHSPGRERIPEPMVMDDAESVAYFHTGGGANPGMRAVYDLCARSIDALLPPGGRILDLGIGSGRALSAVLRRRPDVHAVGVDLAPNMLATAQELFTAEGLDGRAELVQADITALPESLAAGSWDAVSCMWTLHQLPDVEVLGAALRQIAAVQRDSGAGLWISDFARLKDPSACPAMLQCVDPDSPMGLRQDAIASEAAAFTREELSAELAAAGLGGLRCGHCTPLPYLQAYWMFGARGKHAPIGQQDSALNGQTRREAALLRWGFTAKPF
ncbi:class I SAM-dependent methyltransferase [Candidatus Mycolicibacterium alkanivorans]|uniref:Methyltransferase domain-containing protein n=1 Tax=Candidatus Mycolicibacterium alkanivorans TaxID=2954114 RepID=A0ABS9YTL4_9MYCO|nr:class I SAM-dependent methyltransferase [Candidatus Mycolicibacterium alkanivorans]MCI4673719.1 methyltransferase domain-containing protein [Candidatus Mycolicibacterium alkanivorans]